MVGMNTYCFSEEIEPLKEIIGHASDVFYFYCHAFRIGLTIR